jgi:hypothetical protein
MTLRTRRYLREAAYIWDDEIVRELIDRGWKRNKAEFRKKKRGHNEYTDVLTKRFGKFLIRAYSYMEPLNNGSMVVVRLPLTAVRALDFPGGFYDLETREPKIKQFEVVRASGHTLDTYANDIERASKKISLEFSKIKRKPKESKDVRYGGSIGEDGYALWRKDVFKLIQYIVSRHAEKEDMPFPLLVEYLKDYGMIPLGITRKQLYGVAKADVQKLLKQGVLGQGEDSRGKQAYFWTNKLPRPMTPRQRVRRDL